MMKNDLFNKDLADLANKAKHVFDGQMKIASKMIDQMPDSEIEKKQKLKALLNSAKNKNMNHNALLKQLTDIINGR